MKTLIKKTLGNFFKLKAVHSSWLEDALTVFLYHDVSDKPSEFSRVFNLNVPPDLFEYQIKFIRDEFNVINPDDLLNGKITPKAALISFDDGFRSYFKTAVPILEKYAVPSIIFLNMGPVKGEIFWSGFITYLCQKNHEFVRFLKERLSISQSSIPLFLYCPRTMVNEFLMGSDKKLEDFKDEIAMFMGEFASENDLREAENKSTVFLGNHLYNHDVPILMSDKDLLNSYKKNQGALKRYQNSREMFSFPFGQPGTCFSEEQVDLLYKNGAQKIFYSSGTINSDISSLYLDRIALSYEHNSQAKIWFQICQRSFRQKMRMLN